MTTTAVYQGSRRSYPNKRVFILSRSAVAGQQRSAAGSWSGDIVARWRNLRDQISAGVNFSMSSIPNWTSDIGGFILQKRYQPPQGKNLQEWRELQLRWFQFGAFCSIFRSHGVHPYREMYNIAPPGSLVFKALAWYDRLRYCLTPYIYMLAGDTFVDDGTTMRGLVMDFPHDARVRNLNDEYMFGPAFLVAPVTCYKARERSVYLPAGTAWYDFTVASGFAVVNLPAPTRR